MDNKLAGNNFFDNPKLHIKVLKRNPQTEYPLHEHDFYELVIVADGSGINFTAKYEQLLQSGDVICIPPGFQHGYKNCDNLILYNILIEKDLIEKQLFDVHKMAGYSKLFFKKESYGFTHIKPSEHSPILNLIETLERESENHSTINGAATMAVAAFYSLIVTLCRISEETELLQESTQSSFLRTIDYIDTTLDRTVTNEELMNIAGMSSSTLNRTFRQNTGFAPVEYQIHKRINKACNLIVASEMRINEVAEATGFYDANYFSRQFKKIMKITPREYKNKWKRG